MKWDVNDRRGLCLNAMPCIYDAIDFVIGFHDHGRWSPHTVYCRADEEQAP